MYYAPIINGWFESLSSFTLRNKIIKNHKTLHFPQKKKPPSKKIMSKWRVLNLPVLSLKRCIRHKNVAMQDIRGYTYTDSSRSNHKCQPYRVFTNREQCNEVIFLTFR